MTIGNEKKPILPDRESPQDNTREDPEYEDAIKEEVGQSDDPEGDPPGPKD